LLSRFSWRRPADGLAAGYKKQADTDPAGDNEMGLAERRVVTVAVAAILDAVKRARSA
jgi:hypothetical protein